VQSFRGATHSLVLTSSLAADLKALSRREGVSLFMTLLAGFQLLLYRYTAQTDIIVGCPVANRNQVELEPLIGFFVNMLVLRTNLAGNPTFSELVHRVRDVVLEASAHQDLPFERLVEELQPRRNLSYTPLFQVALVFLDLPRQPLAMPGLAVDLVDTDAGTAKFDMTLFVKEQEQGLITTLEYNTALFEASSAARMLEHLAAILAQVAARPQLRPLDIVLDGEEAGSADEAAPQTEEVEQFDFES
jgi:non-ribosomal peptide synthetase component F